MRASNKAGAAATDPADGERAWEVVSVPGQPDMRIDEDGYTIGEIRTRDDFQRGSRMLAMASRQERARTKRSGMDPRSARLDPEGAAFPARTPMGRPRVRDHVSHERMKAEGRDPCIRCGVRGDVGCKHQRPA